jgi:hypothetical protein
MALHRITAIFDKDKVFEKILNLDYLISIEPYAEKDNCYLKFVTTTEEFSFVYNNMEDMKMDYDKIHESMSDQFNSTQTVINGCIDIKTSETLLG